MNGDWFNGGADLNSSRSSWQNDFLEGALSKAGLLSAKRSSTACTICRSCGGSSGYMWSMPSGSRMLTGLLTAEGRRLDRWHVQEADAAMGTEIIGGGAHPAGAPWIVAIDNGKASAFPLSAEGFSCACTKAP